MEQTAYLVVSEAMTNAAKHSSCERMLISGGVCGGMFHVTVADDGRGGAVITDGHGLAGLASRIDALNGTLVVSSPSGGPTEVTMRCPVR